MPNKEDASCVNEKKGLLQDCLPGVTLPNGNVYNYQQQRHDDPSRSSSSSLQPPHELDQLQHHILVSKISMNQHRTDQDSICTGDMNDAESPPSIHVLYIDNMDGHKEFQKGRTFRGYGDDFDFDDMASFSVSIRQAAATSEARRRTEQRRCFSLKLILVGMVLLMLWDRFQPTNTSNNIIKPMHRSDVPSQAGTHQQRFRLYTHWKNKMDVNSMHDKGQQQLDERNNHDDEKRRQILVVLKDLDEAIEGDIVLRSNKTKFQNAARAWRREDFVITENDASWSSDANENLLPLAVVEAATLRDVQITVPILAGLQRDYQLGFRVRSGGYAYMSGYSTIPGGVVLSLAKLNSIEFLDDNLLGAMHSDNNEEVGSGGIGRIDGFLDTTKGVVAEENHTEGTVPRSIANPKTVRIGPGVRTEQFMKDVLDTNGYSGIVASAARVAMGGYVAGGGYGLQSRMYGLAIDNVLSLQTVLASGKIKNVTVGDDLFWALAGVGGGNIGVVTSMEYRVYPSHDIKLAAIVKVSLAEMTQFLRRLGEKEADLSPEFTLSIQGLKSSNNRTFSDFSQVVRTNTDLAQNIETKDFNEEEDWLVKISMFWMGDSNPDDPVGAEYIKKEIIPLFSNSSALEDISYYYFSWSGMSREREQRPESKSVWSAQSWNGFLLPGNNTEEVWADIESSLSAMILYCKYVSLRVELWGGAISKIPFNATAFPYREAIYNIGIDLLVPTKSEEDAASDEMHLVNAIWPSIARHLDGAFVNYPMASLSSESYASAYWGKNLDRLIKLKDRYDPSGAIQTAQSIPIPRNTSRR